MRVDLAVDSDVVYEKVFALQHLGKACADIPGVPETKVCAEFEDTNMTAHEFTTCIDLSLEILHHHVGHPEKVGCIHFHI